MKGLSLDLLPSRYLLLPLLLGLFALLAACSPSSVVEKLLTPQERRLIEAAVQDVVQSDHVSLAPKMRPELAPQIEQALPAMRQALPPPPRRLDIVNVNVNLTGGTRTAEAVYQIKGASGFALLEAVVTTQNGRTILAGLHIQQTKADVTKANDFRLTDGGSAGWFMIAAMLGALAVTIAAVAAIWRSGQFQRRWLWTIGAVVGLTTLRLSWGTSDFEFQPLSFQIFSVSAFKSPLEPWALGVSIPVVALIALARARRKPRTAEARDAEADA